MNEQEQKLKAVQDIGGDPQSIYDEIGSYINETKAEIGAFSSTGPPLTVVESLAKLEKWYSGLIGSTQEAYDPAKQPQLTPEGEKEYFGSINNGAS